MAINYKLIGRRVKETRCRKNLSQAMLAEFTDSYVAYIGHIETGRKQASLESLVRIANVLNTTVDYLLAGNLVKETGAYVSELSWIFEDCSTYEKQIIVDLATSVKDILSRNKELIR